MKTSRFFVWLAFLAISVLVVFVIGFGFYAYKNLPKDDFSRKVLDIVPYPAVIVDTDIISISEFYDQYDLVRTIQSSVSEVMENEVFSDEEQFDVAVSKTIDDHVMYALAEEYGIDTSIEELDMYTREIFSDYILQTGNDIETVVRDVYNVDLLDFQEYFVKPLYHYALLNEYTDNEGAVADQRVLLSNIISQVQNGEVSFADAARDHSDYSSAEQGGDLGYFSKGERIPLVDDFSFSHEIGDISDVLEDASGLYLLYIEDKKEVETEDGVEEQVKVRAIYKEKSSVEDLIDQKKESLYIKIFVQ